MRRQRGQVILRLAAVASLVVSGTWAAWNVQAPGPRMITGVVDGDTIRLGRFGRSRVVGYDAPEPGGRAGCWRERVLAAMATLRLTGIAQDPRVRVWPEGNTDQWSRPRVRLTLDGEDVAAIAQREGWGQFQLRGGPKPSWC